MPIAVFGYPGRMYSFEFFYPLFSSPIVYSVPVTSYYTLHKISQAKLEATFQMFHVKHVAVGTVLCYDNVFNRLFTINTSTLPGESGGPVVPLGDPTTFCGIRTFLGAVCSIILFCF